MKKAPDGSIKNSIDSKQTTLQSNHVLHFFKVTRTPEELVSAREAFVKKLSPKPNNIFFTEFQDKGVAYSYDAITLNPNETLLEAIIISSKKARKTLITYRIVKEENLTRCFMDSINGDTRYSVTNKYLKNRDFIRYSTESMLKLGQTANKTSELKQIAVATGVLSLNTFCAGWKEQYAYMKAREKIFPNQPNPLVSLEALSQDEYLHTERLNKEIEKLANNYIEDYEQQQRIGDQKMHDLNTQIHRVTMQAHRIAPGCCNIL